MQLLFKQTKKREKENEADWESRNSARGVFGGFEKIIEILQNVFSIFKILLKIIFDN